MLRVVVEVNDKYNWLLAPFAYLFNTYWSELQPVIVAGYNPPNFKLPRNFEFHSIARTNYPAEKWSDGMIEFLDWFSDEYFVFLLCDYWLCRTVDVRGVSACYSYVKGTPNVLRVDLTDDRQYAGGVRDIGSWGCYDIIETPFQTPYQMSTQAGLWNRKLFRQLLVPGKTAWDVEIHTQPPEWMRVLGTRQRPVRYANALKKGKIDKRELSRIPQEHFNKVASMIPEGWGK